MRVRSFEIHGVGDGDLRKLHDHLMETGGFEFRAGGSGFFAAVGERFSAMSGARVTQVIMAAREGTTINIDAVIGGGGRDDSGLLADVQRATALIRGFATRHQLEITDI